MQSRVHYGAGHTAWRLMLLLFALHAAAGATELSLEGLKSKLASAGEGDRPHLCVLIAERQLDAADKLYAGADFDKAQAALVEAVTYSEMARDYAIKSRKYQKQTEIAARGMARKLNDLMHSLAHQDQAAVQSAIGRLQRVRDDLLGAMFHGHR